MLRLHPGLGANGTHPAGRNWEVWTRPYPNFWRGEGGTRHIAFAPLFGTPYSHIWIDFRGIQDAPMRAVGMDYFENKPPRHLCQPRLLYRKTNRLGRLFEGYVGPQPATAPRNFRLDSRDGAANSSVMPRAVSLGQPTTPRRHAGATARLGSLPFAPEIVHSLRRGAGAASIASMDATVSSTALIPASAGRPSFRTRHRRPAAGLGQQRLYRHRPRPDFWPRPPTTATISSGHMRNVPPFAEASSAPASRGLAKSLAQRLQPHREAPRPRHPHGGGCPPP